MVLPHHGDATRRGSYYVFVIGKGFLEVSRQRSRFVRNSGVPRRLSATDRIFTERDIDAVFLENCDRSATGLGVELIHETGNEQPDPHPLPLPREPDRWSDGEHAVEGLPRRVGLG